MPRFPAGWGIVAVALGVVLVVTSGATNTTAPQYCKNVTDINATVHESGLCVKGKIKHRNDSKQFNLFGVHKVFCKNWLQCRGLENEIFVTDDGCVIPHDYLSQLDLSDDHIFFGRILSNKKVALTANPLLFDKQVEDKILDIYGNVPRQSLCQCSPSRHVASLSVAHRLYHCVQP